MEELDTSWIVEFEKYNDFYKESVTNINVNYLYIDNQGNIEKISTKKKFLSEPNVLSKEELIYLLKKELINNREYSVNTIFKFNISLDNDDIISLYNDKIIDFEQFIKTYNGFEDIEWKQTINLLKDMNELNIVFMKKNRRNNMTKRIYISKKNKNTRKKY